MAEYTDSARVTYDVVYKRIRDTDWHLIVRIPRSESLGFLDRILFNTTISGILIIAFIVALLFQILPGASQTPVQQGHGTQCGAGSGGGTAHP